MDFLRHLPASLVQVLRRYLRKLWVRVALMGLLAFVTIALTPLVERMVPNDMGMQHPGESADRLLNLIANAMLAVTTFSLTVMVTLYRSSSSQWTPRVHQLIAQDRITQNTLAAFIGAYVFALFGIVLREFEVLQDGRAFVLFCMTVGVIAFVVWSIIRWVLHLQTLGSLVETTRQVEQITSEQFRERLKRPCLGAVPWDGARPDVNVTIEAHASGYVQEIFVDALQELACEQGVHLYLDRSVGSFVFLAEPLVHVSGTPENEEALRNGVARLIVLDEVRTFEQDPRFGLLVLSEIGSRALSPGINDPGTAIDVLNRNARILSLYQDECDEGGTKVHDHLHARPLEPGDLIEDAFCALARDGASNVEVQQRLQRCIAGLMHHPDNRLGEAARELGLQYLKRALGALDWQPDRERLLGHAHADLRKAIDNG